jgi:hypothetical protein
LILAAREPDIPDLPGVPAPTTKISGSNIIVTWSKPYYGGSSITSYVIQFRQNDNTTFTVDLVDCDGSQSGYLTSTTCTVPIASMRASPFELTWGSSVYVKVSAQNQRGTSAFSTPSNGAIILTYPSPTTLSIVAASTAGEQITLSWTKVVWPVDGGTPVLDYTVMFSTTGLDGSFTQR